MEVDAKVLTEMVDFVEVTQPLLEKAAQAEQQLAAEAPSVADALIEAGLLPATKRAEAIEGMKDPLRLADSLKKVAAAYAAKQEVKAPATLGQSHEVKQAGVETSSRGSKSEADKAFLRKLGF